MYGTATEDEASNSMKKSASFPNLTTNIHRTSNICIIMNIFLRIYDWRLREHLIHQQERKTHKAAADDEEDDRREEKQTVHTYDFCAVFFPSSSSLCCSRRKNRICRARLHIFRVCTTTHVSFFTAKRLEA